MEIQELEIDFGSDTLLKPEHVSSIATEPSFPETLRSLQLSGGSFDGCWVSSIFVRVETFEDASTRFEADSLLLFWPLFRL